MDGFEIIPLLKAILPKVPTVGKSILSHTMGFSPTSYKWNLRDEVVINVLRSFILAKPQAITKTQKLSMIAPPVKGRIWISKVVGPEPQEDDLRQKLFAAIEDLKEEGPSGAHELDYLKPKATPVEAEWTGYRCGATKTQPELRASEAEKFKEMMKEATSPTTVLYLHGGAYYLMDPATHRSVCKALARLTKGRCYSIRYRLAPQNPFPAALIDALISYFTLLYPPAGSFHTAVDPKHIVLAGDSAGGNLATVLLITLLHWHKTGTKISWNGVEVEVPLPAGIACNSPWLDLTHSSPSCDTNGTWDYLPTRSTHPEGVVYPSDSIWPPKAPQKPRKTLYADDCLLLHPLVSPLGLRAEMWKELGVAKVPVFMCFGEELLHDEAMHVAGQIVRAGGTVKVVEYEAMPHCFAMVFAGQESSMHCFGNWATAISEFVEGSVQGSEGKRVRVKGLREEEIKVEELGGRTEEEVREAMVVQRARMSSKEEDPLSKL